MKKIIKFHAFTLLILLTFAGCSTKQIIAYRNGNLAPYLCAVLYPYEYPVKVFNIDDKPLLEGWREHAFSTCKKVYLSPGLHKLKGRYSANMKRAALDGHFNFTAGKHYIMAYKTYDDDKKIIYFLEEVEPRYY